MSATAIPIASFEAKLESVLQFNPQYLKDKLLSDGKVQNEAEYNALFTELKKYLLMCSLSDTSVAMLSTKVDAIWHEFILFTKGYREFCQNYLGKFVDHTPNTESTPTRFASVKQFVVLYTETCGDIPNEIWGINNVALMEASKGLRDTDQVQAELSDCSGAECSACCDGT